MKGTDSSIGPFDVVAFMLEVAVLVAVGYWGFTLRQGIGVRVLAGICGPVLMAVLWGLFGAPTATPHLPGLLDPAFRVLWFIIGGLALAAADHIVLGIALVLVYLANRGALHLTHR